jgi:hypothetical protein
MQLMLLHASLKKGDHRELAGHVQKFVVKGQGEQTSSVWGSRIGSFGVCRPVALRCRCTPSGGEKERKADS